MMLDEIIANCNPGIRRVVQWLNENGFRTMDSGDGVTHEFECDREEPYVIIDCGHDRYSLLNETDRLYGMIRLLGIDNPNVQASYLPDVPLAVIDLIGVTDSMLEI